MYGVIDIGSNTIRLAVYKVENSSPKPLFSKKFTAGLASYINKSGALSKKGIEKAVNTLKQFTPILENVNLSAVYVFATASLRNIRNSEYALKTISRRSGFDIQLISGEQEGILSFYGANLQSSLDSGLMTDIGGGSTELVFFENKTVKKSISFPFGSLSIYKKYVDDILPTEKEIKHILKAVREYTQNIQCLDGQQNICAVGGSARAILYICNHMLRLDSENTVISYDNLKYLLDLYKENSQKFAKEILKTAPERIHTLIPGLTVLYGICHRCGQPDIYVSPYGIREGYLRMKIQEEKDKYEQ